MKELQSEDLRYAALGAFAIGVPLIKSGEDFLFFDVKKEELRPWNPVDNDGDAFLLLSALNASRVFSIGSLGQDAFELKKIVFEEAVAYGMMIDRQKTKPNKVIQ